MSVKINALEVENLKRIKAVRLDCSGKALTVIGGKNGQGKTSVLDAIAYALGGERYRPSNAHREGSMVAPEIKLTLSNGLIVERRGKKSALKVTDPKRGQGGQQLLNEFIHVFALDLPKFLNAGIKEKSDTLLQIIGVGDQLKVLEEAEKKAYDNRHAIGQIADQKIKYAEEMPYYPDTPEKPVSVSDLIKEQQQILAKNGENQRKRERLRELEADRLRASEKVDQIKQQIAELTAKLTEAVARADELSKDVMQAHKTTAELEDEATTEIEHRLSDIETINTKIRANLDKQKALDDADHYKRQYLDLSQEIEDLREKKRALLEDADLPLPGLSVANGELVFNGQPWDGMSGSEQLRVATAIVRKLNPECGFVLLDKLEQMDLDTLREFGEWLESEGLQAIGTRVGNGDECSIIIEDGSALMEIVEEAVASGPKFKEGEF